MNQMVASFPSITTTILLVIAIVFHVAKEKFSPIEHKFNLGGDTGWFTLKSDAESGNLALFQLFFAIKWTAIGAVLALELPHFW